MRKLLGTTSVSLVFVSNGAFGLDLGAIDLQSALNQPMSAEIELTSVQPGELQGITVQLASAEAFVKAGIERSRELLDLRFTVGESSGSPVININSTRPVHGPFLSFLVEVNWRQGRIVREYTILIDPPVFMSPNANEGNLTTNRATVVQRGKTALVVPTPIDRSTSSLEERPRAQPIELEEVPDDALLPQGRSTGFLTLDEVFVNAGDTLFEIARDNTIPGTSVQQMMIAILAANESSFISNNINLVMAGAVLQIPDAADVRRVTQAEALAAVNAQNQLWQDYRDSLRTTSANPIAQNVTPDTGDEIPQPEESFVSSEPVETTALVSDTSANTLSYEARAILEDARQEILDRQELRIVADNESSSTTDSATANELTDGDSAARIGEIDRRRQLAREELGAARLRENNLSDQAGQLQEIASNLEALISLRQNELARLEAQLAEARQTATQSTQNASNAADKLPGSANTEVNAAHTVESGINEAVATANVAAVDQAQINETRTGNQNVLSALKYIAISGIAVLGLLGVLGLLFFLRKHRVDYSEGSRIKTAVESESQAQTQSSPDARTANSDSQLNNSAAFTAAAGTAAGTEDTRTDNVEDKLDNTTSDLGYENTILLDPLIVDPVRGIDSEDNINNDDIIAAANVALAYGLYGQAEAQLTKAIERNPDNQSYTSKLLQIYHEQGNSNAFHHVANHFHRRFGGFSNPEWHTIAAQGAELSPNNPLYKAAQNPHPKTGYDDRNDPAMAHEDFFVATQAGAAGNMNRSFFHSGHTANTDYESEPVLMNGRLDSTSTFASNRSDLGNMGDRSNQITEPHVVVGDHSIGFFDNGEENTAANEMLTDELDLTVDSTMSLEELDTMLDVAKAYINMGDKDSASSALAVIAEGGSPEQVTEAKTLLRRIF